MGVTEAEFSPWASFCNHDFKEDFLKEEESGAKYKSEWGKKKGEWGTSLVVQWLRILLPIRGRVLDPRSEIS